MQQVTESVRVRVATNVRRPCKAKHTTLRIPLSRKSAGPPTRNDFLRHGCSSKDVSPLQYHHLLPRFLQIRCLRHGTQRATADSRGTDRQQNSRQPSHCVLPRLLLRRTAPRGCSRVVRRMQLDCSHWLATHGTTSWEDHNDIICTVCAFQQYIGCTTNLQYLYATAGVLTMIICTPLVTMPYYSGLQAP